MLVQQWIVAFLSIYLPYCTFSIGPRYDRLLFGFAQNVYPCARMYTNTLAANERWIPISILSCVKSSTTLSPCSAGEYDVGPAFEIADDVCAFNKYRSNMCNQITGLTLRDNLVWHFFYAHRKRVPTWVNHGWVC